jgi:hypothetical protein
MPARRSSRARDGDVLAEERQRIRLVKQEQRAKAALYPPARKVDVRTPKEG